MYLNKIEADQNVVSVYSLFNDQDIDRTDTLTFLVFTGEMHYYSRLLSTCVTNSRKKLEWGVCDY
jgi:hypothetical protein